MNKNMLLREFITYALDEASKSVEDAKKLSLGLIAYEGTGKKAIVLFNAKDAALQIYNMLKSGTKTDEDFTDVLIDHVVGFILGKKPKPTEPSWGATIISTSAAKKGYGPMMYDIAMDKWGRIAPDRSNVSPGANKIWDFYASKRGDVKRLQFDDVEDPRTLPKEDDATLHDSTDTKDPLNAAYEGAKINTDSLEKIGEKFIQWAVSANIDPNKIKRELRHAGARYFVKRYME